MKLQSELTDTLRRKGDKSRMMPATIPPSQIFDQREMGDGSSEQSNATAEFPDASRHTSDRTSRDPDKRRHRQSWESMVNKNSGCIIEDEVSRYDDWSDRSQGQSHCDPGSIRDQSKVCRTANETISPIRPQQVIFSTSQMLSNQPDCIQPVITDKSKMKRDTEV